jgi:plastocyanin/predicted lipoprotein with Yx(FWY)xxD motif
LNFKAISAVLIVLTLVFAAATGYLLVSPTTTTQTNTATQTVVSTQTSTTTQTATSTVSASGSPSYSVNIAYKSGIGFYLTNGTGFTLYFRSTDKPNTGTSTCTTAGCEANWPVFYKSSISVPPGLNASAFTVITAYNTTQIVTYDGYPLYYWVHDTTPGATTGQGTGGFYAATVPTPTVPATTSTTTSTTSVSTSTSSSSTSTSSSGSTMDVAIPNGIGANTALNFEPSSVTVAPGTTIVFINSDTTSIHDIDFTSVPSGVTLPSNPSPNTNKWTDNEFSVTLTTPGTYSYLCDYHSWMMGTITVS